jgi:hypothetical protein
MHLRAKYFQNFILLDFFGFVFISAMIFRFVSQEWTCARQIATAMFFFPPLKKKEKKKECTCARPIATVIFARVVTEMML